MAENAIEVQEKPILFSGAMVRAVIELLKTHTRRVKGLDELNSDPSAWRFCAVDSHDGEFVWQHKKDIRRVITLRCPYGKPGDRLWVRESWTSGYQNGCFGTIFKADSVFIQGKRQHEKGPHFHAKEIGPHIRWRPSIHMPRWASRLTLEIVGVKVERVQEISGADVLAEGIDNGKSNPSMGQRWENMQHMAFQELWDSINDKRGCGWKANPWTWAIEFKVLAAGERRA